MDFDLSDDELTFEKEVVAFLEANHSDEVMDANPEHLSQTVETPPKRAFMGKLGCNLLVRGHEKVNAGFKSVYRDEDIRLLTVFSAGGLDNDDIPADSNYRDVRPMALTITRTDGELKATPWAIDYARYQSPELNAFKERDPEIDITGL